MVFYQTPCELSSQVDTVLSQLKDETDPHVYARHVLQYRDYLTSLHVEDEEEALELIQYLSACSNKIDQYYQFALKQFDNGNEVIINKHYAKLIFSYRLWTIKTLLRIQRVFKVNFFEDTPIGKFYRNTFSDVLQEDRYLLFLDIIAPVLLDFNRTTTSQLSWVNKRVDALSFSNISLFYRYYTFFVFSAKKGYIVYPEYCINVLDDFLNIVKTYYQEKEKIIAECDIVSKTITSLLTGKDYPIQYQTLVLKKVRAVEEEKIVPVFLGNYHMRETTMVKPKKQVTIIYKRRRNIKVPPC